MKSLLLSFALLGLVACDGQGSNAGHRSTGAAQMAAPQVPAAFHGDWATDEDQCSSNDPQEAGNWFSISAGRINGMNIRSIKLHSPTDIEVSTDAAKVLGRSYRFELSEGGRALTDAYDDRTAAPLLIKCQTTKNA
jgi:hypothetical protein